MGHLYSTRSEDINAKKCNQAKHNSEGDGEINVRHQSQFTSETMKLGVARMSQTSRREVLKLKWR